MREVPPVDARSTRRGAAFIWIAVGVFAVAAALLYFFNPAESRFYPRCYLKVMTGLDCPGCGGLRATHQLLHGHIAEAFTLNPLFVVALPIGCLLVAIILIEKFSGWKLPRLLSMTTVVWICASVTVCFGVLRNLPWRAWLGM